MRRAAFSHPDVWKRNLSTRVMLLIIYERNIKKVTSKRTMQEIYETAQISSKVKKSLTLALRELAKVQKKITKTFSETRNNTIAHRDCDAVLQYELMKEIDLVSAKKVLEAYFKASNKFLDALPALIREVNAVRH